jgi:hypothetical protein
MKPSTCRETLVAIDLLKRSESMPSEPEPLLTSKSCKTLSTSSEVNLSAPKCGSSGLCSGPRSESTQTSSVYVRCINSANRSQISSGPEAKRPSKCITDGIKHRSIPRCSDPCSASSAQSIESSNKVSEVQVCKCFRQWWYHIRPNARH